MITDPETRLNLLLRRADWRFFMPNPQPRTTLNLAQGLLGQAVEEISGALAGPDRVRPGECDLAVAVDPHGGQLRKIYEALAPGGGFYSEWYRPIYGGPGGIRRRLERAGFTGVQCYWPWPFPNHGCPVFWLPLEQDHLLAYFLASRPRAHSRRQRGTDFFLRAAWQLLHKARLLVPVCVAARKPDPAPGPGQPAPPGPGLTGDRPAHLGPPRGLLEAIQAVYPQYAAGHRPGGLVWLLLTGGQRRVSKVVAPVFVSGERSPRFILKMNRVPEGREQMYNEASVLQAIQAQGGDIQENMPRLLFTHEQDGVFAIAQSLCRGQPVFTLLDRQTYGEIAHFAGGWLARLAQRTARRDPTAARAYLQRVLDEFAANYRELASPGEIAACRAQLTRLEGLPLVCEHRDCTPWNWIRSSSGQYALLDWEDAVLDGLPAVDLVFFLTYLALFFDGTLDRGDFLSTYRQARDPRAFTGQIHAACLRSYLDALGLPPALLDPLRLFTWTLHANLQYRRYLLAHRAAPGLGWMQSKLYPRFWKAEIAGHAAG